MRRTTGNSFQAVAHQDTGFSLFANRADVTCVTATDTYKVFTLAVNVGVSFSFFMEETPEIAAAKLALNASVPVVNDGILELASPDKISTYCTIDLASLVPEGWVMQVQRLTEGKPISFGILLVKPGYEDEVADVHRITNTDYRKHDDVRCSNKHGTSLVHPKPIQCQREEGHLGEHQGISGGYQFNWQESGAAGSPYGQFGFKCVCPHCGYVTAGPETGVLVCSLCSFWLTQHQHDNSFIIEGKHYRPGAGGFGGRIFRIQRNDGSRWSGELFMQGSIPAWMKDRFPDNAVFIEDK